MVDVAISEELTLTLASESEGFAIEQAAYKGVEFLQTQPSRMIRWAATIDQTQISQTSEEINQLDNRNYVIGEPTVLSHEVTGNKVVTHFRPAGSPRDLTAKVFLSPHPGFANVVNFTSKIILNEDTSGENTETGDDFVKGVVFPGSELEDEGVPHYLESSPTVYMKVDLAEVSYDLDIGNRTSQSRNYDNEPKPRSGGLVRHGGSGLHGIGLYSYDKSDLFSFRYSRIRDFADRYRGMSPYFQYQNHAAKRRGEYTRTTYIVFGNTQQIEDTFKELHNYHQLRLRHKPVAFLEGAINKNTIDLVSKL